MVLMSTLKTNSRQLTDKLTHPPVDRSTLDKWMDMTEPFESGDVSHHLTLAAILMRRGATG